MKRLALALLCVVLMTGCASQKASLDRAMELRAKLMSSQGCAFDVNITADYGSQTQTFSVTCQSEPDGDLTFTIQEPQTIAGISGKISGDGGELTFDDQVLAFELLAEGQVTPISAPWLLVRTLLGGNVKYCAEEDGMLRISVDDGYQDDALHMEIWLQEDSPRAAEVIWQNRRILTLEIENFRIL